MECKDVEWAAFLFNSMGEDWAYIRQSVEIKNNIGEPDHIVNEIFKFLNSWRSRRKSEVKTQIKNWYNENRNRLNDLPRFLVDASLDNETTADKIKDIYRSLLGNKGNGMGDTTASKTLHMLRPDLFVPWDIPIKSWYNSQLNNKDYKTMEPAEKYLVFLKKMQEKAKYLLSQNPNFLSDLNSKVLKLYEGNLEQARNNELKLNGDSKKSTKEKIDNYTKMVEFMRTTGKTLAKYLDEYNWITITNNVKIKPEWRPY